MDLTSDFDEIDPEIKMPQSYHYVEMLNLVCGTKYIRKYLKAFFRAYLNASSPPSY